MVYYEIKKVFSKTGSKVALLVLALLMGLSCYFAISSVYYVNEEGETERGYAAVRKLRAVVKEWSGELTEERIARAIEENSRIKASEEYQAYQQGDIKKGNIAYSWGQGFHNIREMLSWAAFRETNYYRIDSLTPEAAWDFYPSRIRYLKEWLESEENEGRYSEAEKEYLIKKYEELKTPLQNDYVEGWEKLLEYGNTVTMFTVMVLAFLVTGIFCNEFSLKADAIFYSSYHGRKKAVAAKVKAAFLIVTGIYWSVCLAMTAALLFFLGADGGDCFLQAFFYGYKSFYNITNIQAYLLIMMYGYIGNLFILFLVMLVSVKSRSAVFGVMVPFILIFIPNFIANISAPRLVEKITLLLPDRLLDMFMVLKTFIFYEINGKVLTAVQILPVLYTALFVVVLAALYSSARKAEVKG